MAVFFQYLSYKDPVIAIICEEINKHFATNQQCWLITEITTTAVGAVGFYSLDTGLIGRLTVELQKRIFKQGQVQVVVDGATYLIESLLEVGKVFIFGAGHVGQAVVPVLKMLGFYCVVLDDRKALVTKEFFPDADERIIADLGNIAEKIHISEADYAVVMTRGHQFDFELARQLLKTNAYYIGVMGSKQKIAVQIKRLKESGFSMAEIDRINMPIGLKINAETPAELAISVAGELIEKRAALSK